MSSKIQHDPEFGPIHQKGATGWSVGFRVVLWIGLVMVLMALLLPATRTARPAARRAQCTNNLKQIALALHNYEQAHKTLPPAHTTDREDRSLHSWRTLILPFLEQQALYETIDLSKPWNDPANAHALSSMPDVYRCPEATGTPNVTRYLAVIGPHCCFHPTRGRRLDEISDGLDNTLMLIESPADFSVPWMAPLDADESLVLSLDTSSRFHHAGGFQAAFAEGSVRFLKASLPAETRQALISISGNEHLSPDQF